MLPTSKRLDPRGMRGPVTQAGFLPLVADRPEGLRTKVVGLLGEKDVALSLPARGKQSALARVAARLAHRAGLDHGPVLAALLRREHLGSTAIGNGVALPHARLDEISGPVAMLVTLQHPVAFDAPDGEPVDLLLAVLWPRSDRQRFLPALSQFCRLLRHPELRERIRASESPAEVLAWMDAFEEESAAAGFHAAGSA